MINGESLSTNLSEQVEEGASPARVSSSVAPPRIDARLNRTSILRAVRDVVGVKGDDASIREIADAAGVSTATIYRHFTGKRALIDGVSLLRWSQMLRAAGDGNGSEGIRWAVGIIDAYSRMTTADSGFITALGLRIGHDPAGIGPIRESFDPAFAAIWQDAQKRGEIRRGVDPNDAIELAGAIRDSGRRLQMLTLVVAGIATPEIDPEQLIREMYVRK